MNQNDIEAHLDKMLKQSEREIDKVFAKRTKALLDHLAEMFRKYEEDGSISRTAIYKYRRFEKELEFIKQHIQADYQALYKEIDKLMKQQWLDNFLLSAYVYEVSTATDMQYQIPSMAVVNQAILNPIKELTLPALMTQHRNEILRKIRIELAQGIQAGESYGSMAKRLEKTVDFSRNKARTVAVTEAGRTQVLGRLESGEHAQKHAILGKYWFSSKDSDVRKSHRKLDGDKADEDGYFRYQGHKAKGPSLFGVAKLDIRCRCDVIFAVNGKLPDTMRVRDYDDVAYQKRLAERMGELMSQGLTEKQAEKKAKKQIYPPSKIQEFSSYQKWYDSLLNKE